MDSPKLIFSVPAWCKLQWFLHKGQTEIGGYGVSLDPSTPLYIDELAILKQETSGATVEFDGEDVDNFFYECRQRGLKAGQYGNIWIHTHPSGMMATPSGTDHTTFDNCFKGCPWSVMAIVAKDGDTSALLRFQAGPGCDVKIPMLVDWANWCKVAGGAVAEEWQKEFTEKIKPKVWQGTMGFGSGVQSRVPSHSGYGQGDYGYGDNAYYRHGRGHGYNPGAQQGSYKKEEIDELIKENEEFQKWRRGEPSTYNPGSTKTLPTAGASKKGVVWVNRNGIMVPEDALLSPPSQSTETTSTTEDVNKTKEHQALTEQDIIDIELERAAIASEGSSENAGSATAEVEVERESTLATFLKYRDEYGEWMDALVEVDRDAAFSLPETELELLQVHQFTRGDQIVCVHPMCTLDDRWKNRTGKFLDWVGVHEKEPFLALVHFDGFQNACFVHPESITHDEFIAREVTADSFPGYD